MDDDDQPEWPVPVANLAALVTRNAARRPAAGALVEPATDARVRTAWTWGELDSRVDAVAAGLAGTGLVAGQRIGLLGRSSGPYVVGYLAALRAGLVAVTFDPHADAAELTRRLDACAVRLLLVAADREGLGDRRVLPLTEAGLDELAAGSHSPVVSPRDPEALAALLTTAGTSGQPKTVMLSHRALLAHARQVDAYGVLDPDAVMLGALPLSSVFGLNEVLGSWLAGGARLVVSDGEVEDLLDVVAAEQVSHLLLTPSHLYRLLTADRLADRLASVRTVLSTGAPLPWRLAQEFTGATGLRVEQGYGLTEAAAGVAATYGTGILGPAHVGRALPGVEVRIGVGTEPGEPGPVTIRGDNLFTGYWPSGDGGPAAEGWFETDDIGYLAGTELFLIDRAPELVVVNGFTVYPSEVEQVIGELAGVEAVAVIGGAGARTGSMLVAFVSGREVTEEQVTEHCAARLPPFKRPREVRIVDDLPRGVTGTVQRAALRRSVESEVTFARAP